MKNSTTQPPQINGPVKHTPGPWRITYAETGVRWPVITVPDENHEDGEYEIAQISEHVAENKNRGRNTMKKRWVKSEFADLAEANARLIAAAPNLLAALILISTAERGWAYEGEKSYCVNDIAHDAIAKATGGQQ